MSCTDFGLCLFSSIAFTTGYHSSVGIVINFALHFALFVEKAWMGGVGREEGRGGGVINVGISNRLVIEIKFSCEVL